MVKGKRGSEQLIAREYTINLHKALHGTTFKKRAPKAIKAVSALPSTHRLARAARAGRNPMQRAGRRAVARALDAPRGCRLRRGRRR